jgi:hypothetical protein
VLASTEHNQPSQINSPNPKLSLFTCFIEQGLRGAPEALDGRLLTASSLYEFVSVRVVRFAKSQRGRQRPVIENATSGVLVLGDFSQILAPDAIDMEPYPLQAVDFHDDEPLRVVEVLENIMRWTYSQEYLEQKVNSQLGTRYRDDLGEKAARIRRAVECAASDVAVGDANIDFPGGTYTLSYEADDKKAGRLIHTASFDRNWFGRHDQMISVLNALGMSPSEMQLIVQRGIKPESLVAGLESHGWRITSHLPEKVKATKDGYGVVVTERALTFDGFVPSEILGSRADTAKASLAAGVLALLGPAR